MKHPFHEDFVGLFHGDIMRNNSDIFSLGWEKSLGKQALRSYTQFLPKEKEQVVKRKSSAIKYWKKLGTDDLAKNFELPHFEGIYKHTKTKTRQDVVEQKTYYIKRARKKENYTPGDSVLHGSLLHLCVSQRDMLVNAPKHYYNKNDHRHIVSAAVDGKDANRVIFAREKDGPESVNPAMLPYLHGIMFAGGEFDNGNYGNFLFNQIGDKTQAARIDHSFVYEGYPVEHPKWTLIDGNKGQAAYMCNIFEDQLCSLIIRAKSTLEKPSPETLMAFCKMVIDFKPYLLLSSELYADLVRECEIVQQAMKNGSYDADMVEHVISKLKTIELDKLLVPRDWAEFEEVIRREMTGVEKQAGDDYERYCGESSDYFYNAIKKDKEGFLKIRSGREDDYMLFMRGVVDVLRMPRYVRDRAETTPPCVWSGQTKEERERFELVKKCSAVYRASIEKLFKKEIDRFYTMLKDDRYKSAFNLEDISYDQFKQEDRKAQADSAVATKKSGKVHKKVAGATNLSSTFVADVGKLSVGSRSLGTEKNAGPVAHGRNVLPVTTDALSRTKPVAQKSQDGCKKNVPTKPIGAHVSAISAKKQAPKGRGGIGY